MKTVTILIPENAEEGDTLNFVVDEQSLQLNVTEGMEPGSMMEITLASDPSANESNDSVEGYTDNIEIVSQEEVKIHLFDKVTITLIEYNPESTNAIIGDGTCAVCWKTGELMAKFLSTDGKEIIKGKRIIELGAGLGPCGIAATLAGAKDVVLTDICTKQLQINIDRNRSLFNSVDNVGNIGVRSFVWGDRSFVSGEFDVVLGADLLYDCNVGYNDLVQTLCEICNEETLILIGVRWRKPDHERTFFEQMEKNRFRFQPVESSDLITCKGLDWKSYGDPSNALSSSYLSQHVLAGGEKVPLFSVTEDHQNIMTDEEYDKFESLQIQIYLGHRR